MLIVALFMWNLCILRHFKDWEMDNVKEFLGKLCVLGRSS